VESDDPAKTWAFKQVGPAELSGLMAVEIDDDASKAENVPQDRQDAQFLMGLMGVPEIDKKRLIDLTLRKSGIKNTGGWVNVDPQIPAEKLDAFLAAVGIPKEAFAAFLDQQEQEGQEPQEEAPDGVA
jgi:hypothetical protein